MILPQEVQETLTVCSLRFDGDRWLAERHPDAADDFSPYAAPVVETLCLHADEEENFAACFGLQRGLCKWGGEMLPPVSREHVAWRYLFLHLYRQPVPIRFRLHEYADRWERERTHLIEAHAALVRAALLVNGLGRDLPPTPAQHPGPGLSAAGIEVASWSLVSELVRRAPQRLRVIETHPGGGIYDCLSVLDGGRGVSHLNRQGSLHVQGRLDGQPGESVSLDVWPRLAAGENPRTILDEWCRHLHLAVPAPLPAGTPTSLTYRVIAACLKQTSFDVGTWRCVNGCLDTSGWGGGVLDALFARFSGARGRRQAAVPEDVLQEPAYRFWFLERDGEPRICLETTGMAWLADGASLDLVAEYRRHRNVHAIAALLTK